MRSNDAQGDPIEGFDTADLPPMGPDGLAMPPDRAPIPPPPRLCEAGPCVNYHRFAIQLDVEGPKADSIAPGGQMSGTAPEQPFHVRVHHYCYPTVGIETELGALPVLECNRWQPIDYDGHRVRDRARDLFLGSLEGQQYTAAVDAWKAARAADLESDDDDVETWIAMNLRSGDQLDLSYGEPSEAEPVLLRTLSEDDARTLTRRHVKDTYGPGIFNLWIMRLVDDTASVDAGRERVCELKLEIK